MAGLAGIRGAGLGQAIHAYFIHEASGASDGPCCFYGAGLTGGGVCAFTGQGLPVSDWQVVPAGTGR